MRLYRKIIDNRILPRLGKRRVGDVGKNDVAALHHEMRDVPGHANRTLSVLSRMLTLAEVWEMRPEGVNPCRHVKKYPEHRRERFLSDDEYRQPRRRAARRREGGLRLGRGDRHHTSLDAYGLSERGDYEPAVGVRRSGQGRAQVARVRRLAPRWCTSASLR